MADDVAHDREDSSVVPLEHVVPVAADLEAGGSRDVAGRHGDGAAFDGAFSEQAQLQRSRKSALGVVQLRVLECHGRAPRQVAHDVELFAAVPALRARHAQDEQGEWLPA